MALVVSSSDHVGIRTDANTTEEQRSLPRCYEQDIWSSELVLGRSPLATTEHRSRGHCWEQSLGSNVSRHSRLK
jgi:hypothetical protein